MIKGLNIHSQLGFVSVSIISSVGFNLLYVILLGFVIYWGAKYGQMIKMNTSKTYNLLPSILFNAIFPVIVGIFIAIPEFISRFRNAGSWKLNLIRLIVVGLPILEILQFAE